MLKAWQFWLLTALAALTAALIAANMQYFSSNRQLQGEVNARAQYVQQTVQLEQLGREVAVSLAQLAVRNQDEQVRSLLGSLGISINVGPSVPQGQPAPAANGGRK